MNLPRTTWRRRLRRPLATLAAAATALLIVACSSGSGSTSGPQAMQWMTRHGPRYGNRSTAPIAAAPLA